MPAPATVVESEDSKISLPKQDKQKTVLESHGYNLGKPLGSGSYSTVRVARSERHNGDVAIKIVRKYSAPNDYLKKFLPREIDIIRALHHANIIKFLQAIETTHRVYIIMECAVNGSVLEIIQKDTFIDEVRSKKWFYQLAVALQFCHDHGVCHRDVKCDNLLLDGKWNVKLSDFGFARGDLTPKDDSKAVMSETFCGSYAYASPEILKGIPYEPRPADTWSAGVVLYAMIFGRLPFDDEDYRELLKQVSGKVYFPKEPQVDRCITSLLKKIFVPVKIRISISNVIKDKWFTGEGGQQDGSQYEKDSHVTRASMAEPKNVLKAFPNLLTKKKIKGSEDKDPTGAMKFSLDNEKPLKIHSPEERQ